MEEIDELKEEAEEAKKLAEEWEAKYKEMQRQMEMLDVALLAEAVVKNQSEIARLGHVTLAGLSQIMVMFFLDPEIL